MVNNNLFMSARLPTADAFNNAGGIAYKMTPKQALAQYVTTGCLNSTYYVTAEMQLNTVLNLCKEVDEAFIAKCAIYARKKGFMKDMPALLLAFLGIKQSKYFDVAFDKVIDNGKMLRNFMQIVRSGTLGRKSFGSTMKRKIHQWLNYASNYMLLNTSVGQKPSLVDILRMTHPKAPSPQRNELYKWILGKEFDVALLPHQIRDYELWKNDHTLPVPDVPFQMLTALPLTTQNWTTMALDAPWHMCRMNLNTFMRHGVLEDKEVVEAIAYKLKDADAIAKSRVYPYQLMTAYLNVEADMPYAIKEALQDALEISTQNVPEISGSLIIGVDISGSMDSPVTGHRGSATSKARYVDVAALFGASLLRRNPQAHILPFHGEIVRMEFNPRDTVMTNAKKLSDACTNGTDISTVFKYINYKMMPVDLVVIISDSESWMDSRGYGFNYASDSMIEWERIRAKNPKAKLVCINIAPSHTTQVVERKDIFNIAGFSDSIFDLVSVIANDNADKDYFVKVVDDIATLE